MNIVVLAGGLSTERDVSITSGSMVAGALRKRGHRVVLLDVFMGYEHDECDIDKLFEQGYDFTAGLGVREIIPDLAKIKSQRRDKSERFLGEHVEEICRFADICFLALHGDNGENGRLQATFDLLGIKYTGSGYLGSAVAMNKGITKSIFLNHNIGTPQGESFTAEDKNNGRLAQWNCFPCVVKPCSGGSSVGVSIVESKDSFLKAMDDAFVYEKEVLVEQYIRGREFSIGVIDGKALPIIEIIPKEGFYDYVNKYQSGKTEEICPAELDKETTEYLQQQAEKVYEVLGLEAYGRIDFLLDSNGKTYALEANTLPGMTGSSLIPQEAAAVGIGYEELCDKIIEVSLKKYDNK
ncbi:MAG: D-alanine--D-alanine ligase [Lachnospiraceae bacterium]|nr:D-alanine--D-alanine ligase [Lachnospiraceae bacterium]